jgi:hypothetical protein
MGGASIDFPNRRRVDFYALASTVGQSRSISASGVLLSGRAVHQHCRLRRPVRQAAASPTLLPGGNAIKGKPEP